MEVAGGGGGVGEEFPFGAGQMVESRSNIKGYRGAWFRSVIKYIQIRRGEIWCAMHYIDFPDEKINFMKAYQQDSSGKKKRVLMVRPSYPSVCMGNDESVINAAVGSVVVVYGDWSVGDLVDWFADGCFWAARISTVINKDLVKVELASPPIGEGGSFEASVKDIRPSLDWSVEQLWTVPSAKSRLNIQRPLLVDAPSSSFTSSINALGTLDNEHIFIAKQEPARSTVVQGLNSTLSGHEEAQMKRKSWALGLHSLPEGTKVSDVQPSNGSLKALEPFSTRTVKETFSIHSQPPQSKACPTDLAGKHGLEARLNKNQEQVHNVESDGGKGPLQIDATGKAVSVQHTLDRPNTVNNRVEADLFEEFNALLADGKCLDVGDERIGSSIMALEELLSRVIWLKGVMQLGLKGWCRETKKKKWVFSEREVLPGNSTQQDVELPHNLGSGQAQVGGSRAFTSQNSG